MPTDLPALLARLSELFPAEHPLDLLPSAGPDTWASLAERFPGGHAERWFAATDGQANELPAVLAHTFSSLRDAASILQTTDELRAEPEGYWVESWWIAITTDHAGQHIMLDDRDGRVLMVAHDDDAIEVLAPSAEEWIGQILRDHADGTLVWDGTFGLIDAEELAGIHARIAAREARRNAPIPLKHKVGLALTLLGTSGLVALVIWWLEGHR